MPKARPFEVHTDRYEGWFEAHEAAYRSELAAIRRVLPAAEPGLEIGVGSGRFAGPLGLDVGIDPAISMLDLARERGVEVVRGVAERLPFADGVFDAALIVTAICFVDDITRTLQEAHRVLSPSGALVVGYIDRDSPVGEVYQEKKDENPFYREAEFVSTEEMVDDLRLAGFEDFEFVQTIYRWPADIDEPEPIEDGYGEGSFVAIKASWNG